MLHRGKETTTAQMSDIFDQNFHSRLHQLFLLKQIPSRNEIINELFVALIVVCLYESINCGRLDETSGSWIWLLSKNFIHFVFLDQSNSKMRSLSKSAASQSLFLFRALLKEKKTWKSVDSIVFMIAPIAIARKWSDSDLLVIF